jgi:hypothetical protein
MTPDEILDAEDARLREDREAFRIQWQGAMWAMERADRLAIRAAQRLRIDRADRLLAESSRQRELADRAWAGLLACDARLAEIGEERRR